MKEKDLAYFSQESFDWHFQEQVFLLSEGKLPQEKPLAFLLGGQPGAGKTTLHSVIRDKLDENVIIIDNDSFKQLHPNFKLLAEKYGKDYVAYVTDFSNKMTEALIEYFSDEGYNLIIEGTLRTTETPIKTSSLLKEKGYNVHLYVMAVQKDLSYLGTLERYEYMYLKNPLTARATPKEHHDLTVKNIPENLEKLYKGNYFSDISLFTREGLKIYSSSKTPFINPKNIIIDVINQKVPRDILNQRINKILELAKQNNHELPELKKFNIEKQSISNKIKDAKLRAENNKEKIDIKVITEKDYGIER